MPSLRVRFVSIAWVYEDGDGCLLLRRPGALDVPSNRWTGIGHHPFERPTENPSPWETIEVDTHGIQR